MEIRSTRSCNAIPASMIRGVFHLQISNLVCKMYCKYFNYFSIYFSFFFNYCKCLLVANTYLLTYLVAVTPEGTYLNLYGNVPTKKFFTWLQNFPFK